MSEPIPPRDVGTQNTGNPVLDSTVNILRAVHPSVAHKPAVIANVHAAVLQIALKEPGGLRRQATGTSAAK